MHRFFTGSDGISGGTVTLTGGNAKHIGVLRLRRDELFCICDGRGTDYICRMLSLAKESALCEIIERCESRAESKYKITLFQGLPKSDKLELIIQKCVELGVCKIVPVITENVVVKKDEGFRKKSDRYNKISEAAAQQSGRGIIPEITAPVGFEDAVEILSGMDGAYMAYEKQSGRSLKDAFDESAHSGTSGTDVGFFVGPEGGFTEDEIRACMSKKIDIVSLGNRILRTETAGFVMLTAYLYSHGEL